MTKRFQVLRMLLAHALFVLGLASIAEGIVEFRDFFINIVYHYSGVRQILLGWIKLPWIGQVPAFLQDYMVIASASLLSYGVRGYFLSKETKRIKNIAVEFDLRYFEICGEQGAGSFEKFQLNSLDNKRKGPIHHVDVYIRMHTIWSIIMSLLWPITLFFSILSFCFLCGKSAYDYCKSFFTGWRGECGRRACPVGVAWNHSRAVDRLSFASALSVISMVAVLVLFLVIDFEKAGFFS